MDDEIKKIIDAIIKRGNDVQIRRCADGVKIYEVKMTLRATITNSKTDEKPQ